MRVEALAPGTLVAGRFEIDRFVGSGGMGVVYRARDLQARSAAAGAAGSAERGDSARWVALKLLRVDTLGQIGSERFVREARLLSQLQHPGIVAYVADGTTEDRQPYLAMEWLEGIDLGQRVRKRPLSIAEALVLLERMASILSATHARGIIHRDLKPSNLFLPDGAIEQVKVLDFGVARVADVRSGTQTGLIVGTPAYMSPEQARGLREITPAVDIYSLGCLLYECLSGRPPFPADQPAATLVRVLFEEPRPLELLCPGVPASLIELQRRMMEKSAAARPQNGQALVDALRELRQQPDLREALLSLVPAPVPVEVSDSGWLSQGSLSLLCVVFASLPATASASYGLSAIEKARLLAALQRMGAGVECLASGGLLVTVGEVGNAVEQASLGAQAALLVKEHWPSAAIALTTGRGRWQGQETTGSAVQRSHELWAVAQAGVGPRTHGEARGATPTSNELPPILLDEVSAHLLDGRFEHAETPSQVGRVLLGPLDRPQPVRQLFGGPTPLCGREVELSFLERQLSTCSDDHKAQVVLLTAVPGVGKTRLLYEFLGRVGRRTNPPRVYTAGGLLRSAGVPYSLVRRLLRGALGLPLLDDSDSSDVETLDQKATAPSAPASSRVPAGDGAFVQLFLSELCGVPCVRGLGEDEARVRQLLLSARKEPRLMHQHLRRAFVSWLGTQCQQSAVLIALDDLHWGDALSVSLIDDALRELRAAPLFVLSLGRPDIKQAFPKLWAGQPVHELSLKPLGRKSCERLIRMVRGAETPSEQVAQLFELSAGNPFYLEELLRGEPGSPGVASSGSEPGRSAGLATIVTMLQARIRHKELTLQRILLAASIFGATFTRTGLLALLGETVGPVQIDDCLQLLVNGEVIEPRHNRRGDDREYAFRHGLFKDAAYGLLAVADSTQGHRMAARLLERVGIDEVQRVAEHYLRGHEPERASRYYLQAGNQAVARGVGSEARTCYQRALAQSESLPESSTVRRLQLDILLKWAQLAPWAESLAQCQAHLTRAETLCVALEDESKEGPREPKNDGAFDEARRAWMELLGARIGFLEGRSSEAFLYCSRVAAVAEHLGDPALTAGAALGQAFALLMQGRYSECERPLQRALSLEAQLGNAVERLIAQACAAVLAVAAGRYEAGMAQHQTVNSQAALESNPFALAMVQLLHCISLAQVGDLSTLEERAQALLLLSRRPGLELFLPPAQRLLSFTHALQGELAQSRAEAELAQADVPAGSTRWLFNEWLEALSAEALLCVGEVQAARQLVERKTPSWQGAQCALAAAKGEQVWGLALGCLTPEDPQAADRHFSSALHIMVESGQVFGSVRLRLLWAHLCMRRGTPEQGKRLHAEATAQLTAAGALHMLGEIDRSCLLLPYSSSPPPRRAP